MDMASGKRVKKIFYRTLQDAFTYDALDHIGCTSIDDMDHVADLLKFHSHLLLRHIGCVHDTDTYHRAMPWKCILCFESWHGSTYHGRNAEPLDFHYLMH